MQQVELDVRWRIMGHLDGGYLAAECGRLASAALDGAPPLTISIHYLAPVESGLTADYELEIVRRGRLSTAAVRLRHEGETLVEALVTAGVPKTHEIQFADAVPPELPPIEECVDGSAAWKGPGNEGLEYLTMRLHPRDAHAVTGGAPRDRAHVRGYIAYGDGSADAFLAAAAWDLLPPTPWAAHVRGLMPTVSAQVVIYPGEIVGPLRVEAMCDTMREGVADETARVWDENGRLVASSRQTALLLFG